VRSHLRRILTLNFQFRTFYRNFLVPIKSSFRVFFFEARFRFVGSEQRKHLYESVLAGLSSEVGRFHLIMFDKEPVAFPVGTVEYWRRPCSKEYDRGVVVSVHKWERGSVSYMVEFIEKRGGEFEPYRIPMQEHDALSWEGESKVLNIYHWVPSDFDPPLHDASWALRECIRFEETGEDPRIFEVRYHVDGYGVVPTNNGVPVSVIRRTCIIPHWALSETPVIVPALLSPL
jgi:hypothetical protein